MASSLKTLLTSLSLVAALTFAPVAFAGDAQNLVQARQNEVSAQLRKPASPDRDKAVAQSLSTLFEYDVMAQSSMGTHWGELNDTQKVEFSSLLKQLIQRNLERNIKSTLDYDVQYLGEENTPDGTVVKTKATSKTNTREDPVEIDYTLKQINGAWRSIDVNTEGVSLVTNYRNQFNRILNKDGYPALIKKMKAKLAQGG